MSDSAPFTLPGNTLLSDVAYHDYAMLLVYADAEWTRNRADRASFNENFLRGANSITNICWRYRRVMEANWLAYSKANGIRDVQFPMEPFIYSPVCYTPFGHADDFSFVLLDDFHPVQRLTADIPTVAEDVVLALCPKADTIGEHSADSLLADIHELIDGVPRTSVASDGSIRYLASKHGFQEKMPLLTFSRFKMEGLAVLGQGLLCQHALMRAVAAHMDATHSTLLRQVENDEPLARIMDAEDIKATKVVLLDLQGAEEVGVLIFARNYSVAMSLVAAARCLTFGDMFHAQPQIEQLYSFERMHRAFLAISQDTKEEKKYGPQLLKDNHVFGWTHTTLGVSPWALLDDAHPHCNGFVSALGEVQFSPGHLSAVEKGLRTADCGDPALKERAKSLCIADYYECATGAPDLIVPYSQEKERMHLPILATSCLLSLVKENLQAFGCKQDQDDRGRAISDLSTRPMVLIPRELRDTENPVSFLIGGELGPKHFSTSEVLRKIQQRVFCLDGRDNAPLGSLGLTKLAEELRRLRVPTSLRLSISYLYQNAAALFADPYAYDLVLDVYDSLDAFYYVLTTTRSPIGDTTTSANAFTEEEIGEIAEFLDAMNSALSHRIARGYAEAKTRDMAVDFRGALNQIIAAADVPVKCGLGLYRKFANHGAGSRAKVGALAHVSFRPGAACREILAKNQRGVKLAFFDVDPSHFLHVSNYVDYLHEAFHILWGEEQSRSPVRETLSGCGDVMAERLDEVFVALTCLLFVFDGDSDLVLKHTVCGYSGSLASCGANDDDTVVRFVEFMFRMYLVVRPFLELPRDVVMSKDWDSDAYWAKCVDGQAVFLSMFEKYGMFFSEYNGLWGGESRSAVDEFRKLQFSELWRNAGKYVTIVWKTATRVHRSFGTHAAPAVSHVFAHEGPIRAAIEFGLRNGVPIVRSRYRNPRFFDKQFWTEPDDPNPEHSGLDALWLVCEIMHQYIACRHKWDTERRIHLYRAPATGVVSYSVTQVGMPEKWNVWQVDRGLDALFSPDPAARRERLHMQIVILKTLWDISTSFRARRLWRILSTQWPDLQEVLDADLPPEKAADIVDAPLRQKK